ncbi:MAG: hypothetical protein KF733_03315 [Fimbriimonadaceae bacterium]|nr:MAG: hypothetical protein KF733_03315 [Fimbriimonadaceae bacterium]
MAELLTALTIILVLASVMYPIMSGAKRGAAIGTSVQNLRQLYVTTKLYAGDYDGDENAFHSSYAMGLPPETYWLPEGVKKHWDILKSPCGGNQYIADFTQARINGAITYAYVLYEAKWLERPGLNEWTKGHAMEYRENAVMYFDIFCNGNEDIASPYVPKRVLSVLLSGQIVNRTRTGNPMLLDLYAGSRP